MIVDTTTGEILRRPPFNRRPSIKYHKPPRRGGDLTVALAFYSAITTLYIVL